MPIVFFTQLMGVAFGLEPKKVGVGREYTNASKALVNALKAAPEQALVATGATGATGARPAVHRPRPDKRALPMPRMADSEVEE
jgi:heterodisulfide reductase subunit B